jgi:hypothetical protein
MMTMPEPVTIFALVILALTVDQKERGGSARRSLRAIFAMSARQRSTMP